MRHGVAAIQLKPWRRMAEDFRTFESLGYDVVYVADHLTHPRGPGLWLADGFTTLTAAAGVTERIGLGTLVASATLHSPVALARLASTVQDISGGRLVLGVGAGSPHCARADRGSAPTPAEMTARLEDVLEGLRAVWDGASEWTGATLSFAGVETLPQPEGSTPPPVVVAAHGPRSLALAARFGDGWNTYGGPQATALDPDAYWAVIAEQSDRLEQACAQHDRDPASLSRSLLLGYGTVRPLASVDAYEDAIGRARELGFDELVAFGALMGSGEAYSAEVDILTEVMSRPADR